MKHSLCWAERIAAYETRMRELLCRHRILRQKLFVALMRDEADPIGSHAVLRELHQSCSTTMNGFLEFLEKHGALCDPEKPDLLRVFAALPLDDESLRILEEHMFALQETIEVMALVLDERRRNTRPPPTASDMRPIAETVQEPRITWSWVSPAPTVPTDAPSDPDADPSDERFVVHVQRLSMYAVRRDAPDEAAETDLDGGKKAAG